MPTNDEWVPLSSLPDGATFEYRDTEFTKTLKTKLDDDNIIRQGVTWPTLITEWLHPNTFVRPVTPPVSAPVATETGALDMEAIKEQVRAETLREVFELVEKERLLTKANAEKSGVSTEDFRLLLGRHDAYEYVGTLISRMPGFEEAKQ